MFLATFGGMENQRNLLDALCTELSTIRKEKKISLDLLAEEANIHKSTLSKYERGLLSPKIGTVETWAHALGHNVCVSLEPK